eukprot:XP_788595.3 PREDICTED: SH3 domain-containing protein C23A1.17 isoform X2 [Strongylocentrotus purpuratus]
MPTIPPEAWTGSIYVEGVSDVSCPMESPDDPEAEIWKPGLGQEAAEVPTVAMVDQANTAVAGVEADHLDATAHAADHHAADRLFIKEVNPIPASALDPRVPAHTLDPGVPAPALDPGVPAHALDPGVPAPALDPGVPAHVLDRGVPAPALDPGVLALDPGVHAPARGPGVPAMRSHTPVHVPTPGLPQKARIATHTTEMPLRCISKRSTAETRSLSLALITQEGVCQVISYEIIG